MEICIIKTLSWHLNPPTPSIFLNVVNPLMDACTDDLQGTYDITELARYLLELSVCDGFFIDKKPSSVAYASLLVAFDVLSTPIKIQRKFCSYQLEQSPRETALCAERLHHVYKLATVTQSEDETRASASPTSVLH